MADIGTPVRQIEVTPAELPVPMFAPDPNDVPAFEEIDVEVPA
jgi:hypothetical protein